MKDLNSRSVRIAVTGDVMTGRGIDQVLPFPSDPELHEPYVRSAKEYVELAEEKHGPIPKPIRYSYLWGDALKDLSLRDIDFRIINLETTITRSEDWADKGINYRMNPENIECLSVAEIDCCSLANNHILDWEEEGLIETIETLRKVGITPVGAGSHLSEAEAPAFLEKEGKGRLWVIGIGTPSSGIPLEWAARDQKPGVYYLGELSSKALDHLAKKIRPIKRPGDLVLVSIHWGGNWGYEIPNSQRKFAQALIDDCGVDLVHGHSSHHVKGMEVHSGKLILYGCGDLITDYEGISGYEFFRGDLSLIYLPLLDRHTGRLLSLEMLPYKMRRFQLQRAFPDEVSWLFDLLNRENLHLVKTQKTKTPKRMSIENGVLKLMI